MSGQIIKQLSNSSRQFPVLAGVLLLSAVCFAEDQSCKYESLHALVDDLRYNEIKRDQLLNKDMEKRCIVSVNNVAVEQVSKKKERQDNGEEWSGVLVITYEALPGKVLMAAVYVDMVGPEVMADLHHDEKVSIIGPIFGWEPDKKSPSVKVGADVVRIYGVALKLKAADTDKKGR